MRRLSSHPSFYFKKSRKIQKLFENASAFWCEEANAGRGRRDKKKKMSNMPLGGRCHENHVPAG